MPRAPRATTPPGRSSTGVSPVRSSTVDSRPTGQRPPSRISAGASPRSCGDMVRRGRAQPARTVGRGRGDRSLGGAQQGLGDRVRGGADRHRVEPGRGEQREPAVGAARQDEAQRPRPEPPDKIAGARVEDGERLGLGQTRHMHDQRVEARPALGGKDRGDGMVVRRIAAEPVDGLGRKGDEAARRAAMPRRARSFRVRDAGSGPTQVSARSTGVACRRGLPRLSE